MATPVAAPAVWTGQGVRIAEVAQHLRELRAAVGDEPSTTLTSVLNLIAWAPDQAAAGDIEAVADALREHQPSRAIIIVPAAGSDRIDARVEVTSGVAPGSGRTLLFEQIILTLHGAIAAHAGSAVITLLRSELPTFLWWPTAPEPSSPTFLQLVRIADRVVTETGRKLRGREALSRLAAVAADSTAPVTDLAWAILTPWRQVLATSIRGKALAAVRAGPASVRITCPAGEPTLEALLLGGWLADVLGDHVRVAFAQGAGSEDMPITHENTDRRDAGRVRHHHGKDTRARPDQTAGERQASGHRSGRHGGDHPGRAGRGAGQTVRLPDGEGHRLAGSFPDNLLELIPEEVAVRKLVFPLKREDGVLALAVTDPFDTDTIEFLEKRSSTKIVPVLATRDDILNAVKQHYLGGDAAGNQALKILVVDDSAEITSEIEEALRKEGYEVLTANDGVEGLKIAFSQKPDLILCDAAMPRMDGYALMRAIKANPATAGTPMILLTSEDLPRGGAPGPQVGLPRLHRQADDDRPRGVAGQAGLEIMQQVRQQIARSKLKEPATHRIGPSSQPFSSPA